MPAVLTQLGGTSEGENFLRLKFTAFGEVHLKQNSR